MAWRSDDLIFALFKSPTAPLGKSETFKHGDCPSKCPTSHPITEDAFPLFLNSKIGKKIGKFKTSNYRDLANIFTEGVFLRR